MVALTRKQIVYLTIAQIMRDGRTLFTRLLTFPFVPAVALLVLAARVCDGLAEALMEFEAKLLRER